jgi:hypothetical protein
MAKYAGSGIDDQTQGVLNKINQACEDLHLFSTAQIKDIIKETLSRKISTC